MCQCVLFINNKFLAIIAVFRVLFIKAQTWLKKTIGVQNMLHSMIFAGLLALFSAVTVLFFFDDGPTYLMCIRESSQISFIMMDYLVNET